MDFVAANTILFLSGITFVLFFPVLRASGSLKLEEEFAYPVLFLGIVSFAIGTDRRNRYATPAEEFPLLVAANALFLLALALQLRANAKKSNDGPTHPSDEPYAGGGQAYAWDDEQ